ncbi:MAG: hypothetical protein F6K00_20360 [Leptolyngbya sp. SIOISBB]|nr:hypothetical protein [Leptolyngbya sp. SIOISBB]
MNLQLLKLIALLSILLQPLVGLQIRGKQADLAEASFRNLYSTPASQSAEQFVAFESPDFHIDAKEDVAAISFVQPMAIQDVVNNFLGTLQAEPQKGGHQWEQILTMK